MKIKSRKHWSIYNLPEWFSKKNPEWFFKENKISIQQTTSSAFLCIQIGWMNCDAASARISARYTWKSASKNQQMTATKFDRRIDLEVKIFSWFDSSVKLPKTNFISNSWIYSFLSIQLLFYLLFQPNYVEIIQHYIKFKQFIQLELMYWGISINLNQFWAFAIQL